MNFGKKIRNMIFRKWGGGGSTAVWNFSENSSVLGGLSFPYRQDQVSQSSTLHVFHRYEKFISIHVSLKDCFLGFFALVFVLSPQNRFYYDVKYDSLALSSPDMPD